MIFPANCACNSLIPGPHLNQTFLAELMTAHLMGGEIRTKITEFQLEVLRKLTKWLKEKQQFTAKVDLVDWDEEMWEQLGGSS